VRRGTVNIQHALKVQQDIILAYVLYEVQLWSHHRVLSEADGDTPDESFTIKHCPPSVAAAGYLVTEVFIIGDYQGIGTHEGGFFAQFVLDEIAIHPGFGPDPDLTQLDVAPLRPTFDEYNMIRMSLGQMRCVGIKPGTNIRTAGEAARRSGEECAQEDQIHFFSHF
jgi:hypothetical protein